MIVIFQGGRVEVIEGIDFIEMMREFGRLVILRIENPYNLLWRIGEIRHIGGWCFLRIENPYNLLWRIGEIRHIGKNGGFVITLYLQKQAGLSKISLRGRQMWIIPKLE